MTTHTKLILGSTLFVGKDARNFIGVQSIHLKINSKHLDLLNVNYSL
jgi:hypothetical protein